MNQRRSRHTSATPSNGHYPKTVKTEIGEVHLRVPRDRNGGVEPARVRKGQRRLDLAGYVISLYAKGMTTGDIQAHLPEVYGTEVSRDTISRISDTIVEDLVAWQNRPLDAIYPVLLIDPWPSCATVGSATRSSCAVTGSRASRRDQGHLAAGEVKVHPGR